MFEPATGRVEARGVASRSATLEACLGGELMIMPSLASCDGGAGPPLTGDDWKNNGDEDATAGLLAPDRVLRGVASGCLAGVED
jgi:hypothetical protein